MMYFERVYKCLSNYHYGSTICRQARRLGSLHLLQGQVRGMARTCPRSVRLRWARTSKHPIEQCQMSSWLQLTTSVTLATAEPTVQGLSGHSHTLTVIWDRFTRGSRCYQRSDWPQRQRLCTGKPCPTWTHAYRLLPASLPPSMLNQADRLRGLVPSSLAAKQILLSSCSHYFLRRR